LCARNDLDVDMHRANVEWPLPMHDAQRRRIGIDISLDRSLRIAACRYAQIGALQRDPCASVRPSQVIQPRLWLESRHIELCMPRQVGEFHARSQTQLAPEIARRRYIEIETLVARARAQR